MISTEFVERLSVSKHRQYDTIFLTVGNVGILNLRSTSVVRKLSATSSYETERASIKFY